MTVIKNKHCFTCNNCRQRTFRDHNELALFVAQNKAKIRDSVITELVKLGKVTLYWCRKETPISLNSQGIWNRIKSQEICQHIDMEE